MPWGTNKTTFFGSEQQQAKKIKEQLPQQSLWKAGGWGLGKNRNLGLFGFRGTPKENAEIGKKFGRPLGS